MKTELTSIQYDWRNFGEVYETPQAYYFLFISPQNQYVFIPKRAFETQNQVDAFRGL